MVFLGSWLIVNLLLDRKKGKCVTLQNWNTRFKLYRLKQLHCLHSLPYCRWDSVKFLALFVFHNLSLFLIISFKEFQFLFVFLFINLLSVQRDSAGLTSQNNELKFRLQAMEQQAQLRDGMIIVPLVI